MKRNQTVNLIGAVTLVTLAAKFLGIIREALQARAYGTLAAADLYTAANNYSIYLFTTAAYALCIAAVPILTPRLRRSRKEGYEAAGNLLTITVLLCIFVTVLWAGATFTPLMNFLWDGTASETEQLASYMRVMALALPVIGAAYLLVALFQSLEHFVLQGSMSIPYNIVLIVFLSFFAKQVGVGGYVCAVTAAWLLQLGMTVPYMVKEKYWPRLRLDLRADYVKTFFRTALVTVLTTSIFLFCYLQDSGMTARLDGSPVSAFYYADKLFTPLTTTLIYSISTVLFPKFSQEYASTDQATYRRYIWGVLRSTLAIILPMSMVLAAFGTPIVKVLFEGGNFDAASTASTGAIFTIYSLSMAGFCALDLLSKAYYTMEKTLEPLLVNAGILACNWGLNHIMGSRWGGAGLAAATAVSITLGGIAMAILFLRRTSGIQAAPLGKSLLCTLLSGGALWVLTGRVLNGLEGKLLLVAKCVCMGAAAAVVYALLMLLVRQEDFLEMIQRYRKSA